MSHTYSNELTKLFEVQKVLKSLLEVAETRPIILQQVTNDCAKFIITYGRKYVVKYLKLWFRSFLGVKDECMILLNGELVREYHISKHEKYIHEREDEAHYYNTQCTLSSCSIDGLDYEYRKIVNKYGHKNAFDRLADVTEELSSRVDKLSKIIDGFIQQIKSSLLKIGAKSFKIELRHCGEYLDVYFEEPETRIKLLSSDLRKCSQSQALSTVIEEPKEALPNTKRENPIDTLPQKRLRKKLAIDDSDEEIEPPKEIKKTKTLDLDFGYEASLVEIKRAYGADETLIDEGVTKEDEDIDALEGFLQESSKQTDKVYLLTRKNIDSLQPFGFSKYQRKDIKFKIINPLHFLQFQQKGMPNKDTMTISHAIINIECVYNIGYLEGKPSINMKIDVKTLFQEVCKCLWLHHPHNLYQQNQKRILNEIADENFSGWIPRCVQVNNLRYTEGSMIIIPLDQSKIYPIITESCIDIIDLMNILELWIKEAQLDERFERKLILWWLRPILTSIARSIRKVSTGSLNPSNGPERKELRWEYCDIDLTDRLQHPFQSEIMKKSLQSCSLFINCKQIILNDLSGQKHYNLRVIIRSLLFLPIDFWLLCDYCHKVEIETTLPIRISSITKSHEEYLLIKSQSSFTSHNNSKLILFSVSRQSSMLTYIDQRSSESFAWLMKLFSQFSSIGPLETLLNLSNFVNLSDNSFERHSEQEITSEETWELVLNSLFSRILLNDTEFSLLPLLIKDPWINFLQLMILTFPNLQEIDLRNQSFSFLQHVLQYFSLFVLCSSTISQIKGIELNHTSSQQRSIVISFESRSPFTLQYTCLPSFHFIDRIFINQLKIKFLDSFQTSFLSEDDHINPSVHSPAIWTSLLT